MARVYVRRWAYVRIHAIVADIPLSVYSSSFNHIATLFQRYTTNALQLKRGVFLSAPVFEWGRDLDLEKRNGWECRLTYPIHIMIITKCFLHFLCAVCFIFRMANRLRRPLYH